MDPADIAWLATSEGATATHRATAFLDAHPHGELEALRHLGRDLDATRARAAVALAVGRRSARAKFEDADTLFLDRDAAEQASPEAVARWTAAHLGRALARLDGESVADLGCGAGADTLALAAHARVVAVERDPSRATLARANVGVRGLTGRVEVIESALEDWAPPPGVHAAWLDPSRRDSSGRVLDPERWSPPLSVALEVARRFEAAGIKVAPGIDLDAVPTDAAVEFVSLEGRLVEAVLWLGAAAIAPRRAAVLPAGVALEGAPDDDATSVEVGRVGAYLYDPDPALGRARLIGTLARALDAHLLYPGVAYLAANEARPTPFARRFRVLAAMPFSERRVLAALAEAGTGRVEVMRRGAPIDTNALEVRLNAKLGGGAPVHTLALTRDARGILAILGERERDERQRSS